MRRHAVVLAVALAGLSGPVTAAADPAPNLVQNPGAEAGTGASDDATVATPPSWTELSSFTAVKYGATATFPDVITGNSIGGGVNFFAGGPNTALSSGEQVIDVSGEAMAIDGNTVTARLSGLLGGFLTDADDVVVTADMQDGLGQTTFATVTIGPVTAADRDNETTLLPRSAAIAVPATTRKVHVKVTATRTSGAYNDGYADNIVLQLDHNPVAVDDGATIPHDAGVTAINVLSNDTDADEGPKEVVGVTQPAHGAATVRALGAGVAYAPAAGYCGSDSFTYTLNGGATATVFVTVTCGAAPDTTAPDTTITAGPPTGTSAGDGPVTYAFVSDDATAGFQCRTFDGGGDPTAIVAAFEPCTSPYDLAAPNRPEVVRFEVRAVDAAGNVDATPAFRTLVKHGPAGAPETPSRCRMVTVERSHGGKRMLPGCRLSRIRHGKVPCMQVATLKTGRCDFRKAKGRWLESKAGPDFALVGQAVVRKSRKSAPWIVAANPTDAHTVPCRRPSRSVASISDTAGRVSAGHELAVTCVVEEVKQRFNSLSGFGYAPLVNYASLEVCSSNRPEGVPHPDGARLTRLLPGGAGGCYTGYGAALNDINGTERDRFGTYLDGPEYCHHIIRSGLEVPAAKRPDTRYAKYTDDKGRTQTDYTKRVAIPSTPIRWLPVDPYAKIADDPDHPYTDPDEPEPEPAPAPVEPPEQR